MTKLSFIAIDEIRLMLLYICIISKCVFYYQSFTTQ